MKGKGGALDRRSSARWRVLLLCAFSFGLGMLFTDRHLYCNLYPEEGGPSRELCDQDDESVQHILTNCIFAREHGGERHCGGWSNNTTKVSTPWLSWGHSGFGSIAMHVSSMGLPQGSRRCYTRSRAKLAYGV